MLIKTADMLSRMAEVTNQIWKAEDEATQAAKDYSEAIEDCCRADRLNDKKQMTVSKVKEVASKRAVAKRLRQKKDAAAKKAQALSDELLMLDEEKCNEETGSAY